MQIKSNLATSSQGFHRTGVEKRCNLPGIGAKTARDEIRGAGTIPDTRKQPMGHRDAELSDVVVVLKDEHGMAFADAVASLRSFGLSVSDVVEDEGVIEGTIQSEKVKSLETLVIVECVRCVFSYTANYPPGDPRNLDPDDNPESESADDAGA
jgi:hypothetical protein